jgi:hypothetical protein
MATYFGYVEREADSYVNWADVGRNMSATIDNIQRVRDEKKALIEKAYREDLDYIQSIPSGEHKTLRDWSIGFGNDAAENLKLKYNMLKQGKSSVRDFTSFRENITNDTESLYTTINNIQTVYKEKMDRFKNDENMDLELLDMAQLERFGNLSDTKSFINGLTGSVGVGLTEEVEVDGKKVRALKKGDDAYLTVQQLVSAVNRKYDNYDVRPDIAKWVEGFGEKIKSLRQFGSEIKAGSIIEVMDITNEELMKQAKALGYTEEEITSIQKSVDDFKKAEDLYLKGLMIDNPYHTLATLNKRLNYQPTFSKEEADKDPNKVYCERDNSGAAVPKFTKDQETAVFDYMKGQARLMYDEKVKLNMYNEPRKERPQVVQPTAAQSERLSGIEDVQGSARWIGQLYSGNNTVKQNALEILRKEPGVVSARFVDLNGVPALEILNSLGKQGVIKITQDLTVAQFGNAVASAIYTDTENRKVLNRYQKQFDDAITAQHSTFNPMNMDDKPDQYWTAVKVEKEDPKEREPIGVTAFTKYQADAASDLNSQVERYGLTVQGTASMPGYHRVAIFDKTGKKLSGDIKVGYPSDPKGAAEAAKNFNEQLNDILKRQGGGVGGQFNEPEPE